eukprot:13285721-Ditylum_brightwellii.AAC.1
MLNRHAQAQQETFTAHSCPLSAQWTSRLSCAPAQSTFLKGSDSMVLRKYLQYLKNNRSNARKEERRELEIFIQKFKRFLFDGVPVQYIPNNQDPEREQIIENRIMYLQAQVGRPISEASLVVVLNKREKKEHILCHDDLSLPLNCISCVTQSLPDSLTATLDDDDRGKFFCFHRFKDMDYCDDAFMLIAKNAKDTCVLLCGIKLFLEQHHM